jgi:hypothetical protein
VKQPWCAHLPVVNVPQGAEPKTVTLIYPYYENRHFFSKQIGWWQTFHAELRKHLKAIIVDDGSPEPAEIPDARPFSMRLFRIEQDVRWNWLAARNIGFHHADEGWCLVTDMDHIVPASTAAALVYGKHDPNVIYGLSRIESTGDVLAPHPNSWMMTREMFWKVGGYDEALAGHYGTDGEWRRRMAATAPMQILADRLIRQEHDGDSSTTKYLRKQPQDAAVSRIVAARKKGWKPKTLSFAYHEVVTAMEPTCR